MLFNISVLISLLVCLLMLRRFVGVFPSLMACIVRWKESVNLDAGATLSRDRDMMALAMILPFCLCAEKFSLYDPTWMGNLGPGGRLGAVIGIFTAYASVRKGLEYALRPKKMNPKTYRTAGKASYTFFILLTLMLMSTGGLLSFADVNPGIIRNAMLWVSAITYALFLLRKTQIFVSSCNFFSSFLYLCALEILPTGALVASALIF